MGSILLLQFCVRGKVDGSTGEHTTQRGRGGGVTQRVGGKKNNKRGKRGNICVSS